MKQKKWLWMPAFAIVAGTIVGCQGQNQTTQQPTEQPASEAASQTASETDTASSETGTLQIYANGEDFVRQGFVSKDGWQINFDNVYANFDQVKAYQTDPPYDAESGKTINAKQEVTLEGKTVDLAAGDENADPILLGEITAPAGRYNALSWTMSPAMEGPAAGSSLVMVGTATKGSQTIDFNIQMDKPFAYRCGQYVGDERKGILQAGNTAELEATFHFDHIFGDAEAPADDAINTGAIGFDPLAALAENGQLNVDMATLESQLSSEDLQKLTQKILPNLGHVGEGHCHDATMKEDA
jgi:hypothetical protein